MTLEQLVPTLEVCQQLRNAGFPQDTALAWYPEHCDDYEAEAPASLWPDEWKRIAVGQPVVCVREEMEDHESLCAAPTAGELEEWLMVVFGFREILTNFNPDDSHPERRYMVLGSVHKEQVVQHAYGPTNVAAKATLVLEVAG